jgi:hypothetical protein
LRLKHSDRAQVIAFAGKPTSEVRGRLVPVVPRVDALFYGCHVKKRVVDQNSACKTILWIDMRTGTLNDFWTRDSRYTTPSGVHAGTSTSTAEHALHETAVLGCGGAGLRMGQESGPRPFYLLYISGSRTGKPPKLRVLGGHVSQMVTGIANAASIVVNC